MSPPLNAENTSDDSPTSHSSIAKFPLPPASKRPRAKEERKRKKKRPIADPLLLSVLQNKSILIVDDNILILRVLEKILEGCHHLQSAHNGQEALNIVTERMKGGDEFDLVFMDCMMPVMDGYTAARMMRQLGYRGPILALTGNSSEADAEKAMEAGYNSTVVKPIRADDLRTIIQIWGNPNSSPCFLKSEIHSSVTSSSSRSMESPTVYLDFPMPRKGSVVIIRASESLENPDGDSVPLRTSSSTEPYQIMTKMNDASFSGDATPPSDPVNASAPIPLQKKKLKERREKFPLQEEVGEFFDKLKGKK
jgi:CheY-like chemotaxis protein